MFLIRYSRIKGRQMSSVLYYKLQVSLGYIVRPHQKRRKERKVRGEKREGKRGEGRGGGKGRGHFGP